LYTLAILFPPFFCFHSAGLSADAPVVTRCIYYTIVPNLRGKKQGQNCKKSGAKTPLFMIALQMCTAEKQVSAFMQKTATVTACGYC
jgi:hypothetical protein